MNSRFFSKHLDFLHPPSPARPFDTIQVTQIQQFSTILWDYERLYILESTGALVVVVRKLESMDSHLWVFDIDISKGTWTEV